MWHAPGHQCQKQQVDKHNTARPATIRPLFCSFGSKPKHRAGHKGYAVLTKLILSAKETQPVTRSAVWSRITADFAKNSTELESKVFWTRKGERGWGLNRICILTFIPLPRRRYWPENEYMSQFPGSYFPRRVFSPSWWKESGKSLLARERNRRSSLENLSSKIFRSLSLLPNFWPSAFKQTRSSPSWLDQILTAGNRALTSQHSSSGCYVLSSMVTQQVKPTAAAGQLDRYLALSRTEHELNKVAHSAEHTCSSQELLR